MGQLLADLDLIGSRGLCQRLLIRIDRDKINAGGTAHDHAVHNVIAGTADTNYFQIDNGIRHRLDSKSHNQFLLYFHLLIYFSL